MNEVSKKSENRQFYKKMLWIAGPVMLQQAINLSVNLTDNIMVGKLQEEAISGVALGNQFYFLFQIFCMGLGGGSAVMVGQLWGKKDVERIRKVVSLMLRICIAVAFAFTVATLVFTPQIMKIYTPHAGIIAEGVKYLRIMAFVFLIHGIALNLTIAYRAAGVVWLAMISSLCSFGINIFFNWVFIFGNLGFEPMGALGAGYATLISRVVQCVMLVGYFLYTPSFRCYTRDLFRRRMISLKTIRELLRVGVPISFHMLMESSAFVVAGIMVLAFGAASASAYQIGVNMMNVTFMIVIAIGSATTILTSHIYGRQSFERLRPTVNAAYQMGLVWNVTVALIFIALRFVIPTLFTTNADVIRITASMLIFIALFQVSDCLQAISISILRGLQDVKVIIPIVFLSYVVINIPAGYLMAFRFGMEANGLIIGFIIGLSSCALMTMVRVRRDVKQLESKIGN